MTTPLPPYLDAQDPRAFAHHTLLRRLPSIVGGLLETVPLPAPARARLEAAVARPLDLTVARLALPPEDAARWEGFFAAREGRPLREVPFFEWEAWLYAWLNVETGYHDSGRDPFLGAKLQDFAAALPAMEAASRTALAADAQPPRDAVRPALLRSLLANLADASNPQIQAGSAEDTGILHHAPWEESVEALLAGPEVLVLCDNAMSELWYDLLLARAVARAAPAHRVALVLKRHPTLVSDATPADVQRLWGLCEASGAPALRRAAADVRAMVEDGRIGLHAWAELNTPWSFSAPGLAPLLSADAAFVVKGDANFRRALEDRAWEPTAPLEVACTAPMRRALFLRVLKSECVGGLPAAAVAAVERADPAWRCSGKHATAQLLRRGAGAPVRAP